MCVLGSAEEEMNTFMSLYVLCTRSMHECVFLGKTEPIYTLTKRFPVWRL